MARLPFSDKKSVLAVIHCESTEQALNTQVANENGCDGVFLINHSISADHLLEILQVVRAKFPEFWLGANFLGVPVIDVFRSTPLGGIDGIWTDNSCLDERREEQPQADLILAAIKNSGWLGSYFGGVAFKYQREVDDLASAARIATRYMDVVCTSGPGTGHAASIEKLQAMKQALNGDGSLAVASGITPDNIDQALPWADVFLVATGISRSFTSLDPKLVLSLTSKVSNYNQRNRICKDA